MSASREMPDERRLRQSILGAIKKLIDDALVTVDSATDNVRWTEMRWDMQDITASWPKDEPTRNIHAWVRGSWPRFFVEVEGAVWEDDEKTMQRSIRFVPLSNHSPGIITVRGSTSAPELNIPDRGALSDGLVTLAKDLEAGILSNGVSIFPLQPYPPGQVFR